MITIIMLCHNQLESTKRTIKSLLKFQNNVSYRMIVFDNGSTDNTFEYLKTISGDVSIVQLNENSGFVKPNNMAMQMTTDDVLFLNNDVEVFFDHWLDRLHEELHSQDNIGLTYPLVQTRGQLFYGGIIENKKESLLNYNNDVSKSTGDNKKLKTPTWAQFCCALVKRKVINDIGLLDDKTFEFAYFEDVDFCVRLTEKYKMKLVEDVIVEHFQSVTANNVNTSQIRNKNRDSFYKKWEGKF